MEILTNKFNLPDTIVRAAARDEHVTRGSISVTTLIDAPQIRILKKNNDYEVDVSDKLAALMGTAIHHIIEHSDKDYSTKKALILAADTLFKKARQLKTTEHAGHAPGMESVGSYLLNIVNWLFPEIATRYLYETVSSLDVGEGMILSGTADLYDKQTRTLFDYKSCTVFQYIYPEARLKWEEQTNIYALMFETIHNLPVEKIQVVAMFKDYSKYDKIKMGSAYPKRQTMAIDVPRHKNEDIWNMIFRHRDRHLRADKGDVDACTGKERWATANEYAVKTPTRKKRAVIKLPSEALAHKYLEDNRHMPNLAGAWVETRLGFSKRCDNYCPVSSMCPQYAEELRIRKSEEKQDEEVQNNEFID